MSERLVCGLQPVREAIAVHGAKLRVLVDEEPSPRLDAVARFATDRGADVVRVRRPELDRLSLGARHQGVLAFAPPLSLVELAELTLPEDAIVVVLDSIEDPQNFGAILRSAVAFGAHAVVWPRHGAAPLSPATFRASAGAIEHALLCSVPSLPSALEDLRGRGLRVVGLDAAGDVELAEESLTGAVALVFGAEGKGLHRSVRKACDILARLPMAGPLAHVNVSAAAAVALYETRRQRR